MYRYGDGTPFPLDENFIETLTAAVESCTNAFMPLTELDERRNRAKAARVEADGELARLADLEKTLSSALAPYMVPEKKSAQAQQVAQKTLLAAKQTIQVSKGQIESRVSALEAQASASTSSDAVLQGLRPFFDHFQLPNAKWIMSWDVRGADAAADAVMTAGRLVANFRLAVDQHRQPIRVDQLADGVVVHMMKKGLLGKAKPAPVDLGKYVMVAFERTQSDLVITLREKPDRQSQGLRFTVGEHTATWQSITASGDAETEANPLDNEDFAGIHRLGEGAQKALKDLTTTRTLTDITLGGQALTQLPEPRVVPMELLHQLSPLARTIRERSRMSGELVLKRDIAGGKREELYVNRVELSRHFTKLPMDYRKPFEEMGISAEDTQPAIQLPANLRPPAKAADRGDRPIPPPPPPAAHAAQTKIDPDKTLVAPPVIVDDSLKDEKS